MKRTTVCLPREFPGGIQYAEEEAMAVMGVIRARSPFRFYGPDLQSECAQFENEFGRYMASGFGKEWPATSPFLVTAVNSGTGALEVALEALGVGCGDEVLVPGFMWISTIGAVVRCRAVPVLVDADETMNMDPADIVRKTNDRTKVVLPVHMAGEPARIGAIMEAVRHINFDRETRGVAPLRVLEDVAQAIGGHARGIAGSVDRIGRDGIHRLGTFGDAAIFSLQLNKNITSGEGGIIVTRDKALHRRILAIHDVGFLRDSKGTGNVEDRPDQLLVWGQGRRFTEVQAALARVQLRRLDGILGEMRGIHKRLTTCVQTLPGLTVRAKADNAGGDSSGFLMFHLPEIAGDETAAFEMGRAVLAELRSRGLPAFYCHDYEVHIYYNIPQLLRKFGIDSNGCPWTCPHNAAHENLNYSRGTLPNLDRAFQRTVGIVLTTGLTDEHEAAICAILHEIYDLVIKK
jgi:8-amino-3,8-dideoxy-alpha-D-manno-octulosonate transaminase